MARYNPRGTEKWKFLPAVANLDAPTSGELTAGTDLSPDLHTITGFDYSNTPLETPDISTTFDSQVVGNDKAPASTLKFWDQDTTSNAIRTALAKGTAGFILRAPYGIVSTKRAEIWPVTVAALNTDPPAQNAANSFTAQLSITSRPHQTAVLP